MKRWGAILAVGAVVALLAPAAAAPGRQKVTITLTEYKFTPATVTLQAGVPAELTLVNKGSITHEFMVYAKPPATVEMEELEEFAAKNTYFKGIGEVVVEFKGAGEVATPELWEVEVLAGKTAVVEFTPTRKGTFEIGCHVEGHYEAGMKGTLVVK